ncbi:MAG: TlpA family protein disulfide reductase, partial [Caldilineaceae bacterium]|nr:TlpA family protein disulfide reductase [Caldilineaceae bacterium]
DLVVVAINVREDLETVIPFVQEFGMSMPVAMDTEGALQQRYSVNGMPTSVFIDRDGNVAGIWTGLITRERLEQMLAFIL